MDKSGEKMSIYAISDLHLSMNNEKPMDIFGEEWKNHEIKIRENWIENVKPEDVVLLPGDFSWETYLENTKVDFTFLNELPGKKILLKGNHDYWWSTVAKMKKFLKENNFNNIDFLYNNSFAFENAIIVGTRGWSSQEDGDYIKMVSREALRLKLSFEDGIKKYGKDKEFIVCLHYPPLPEFINIMKEYNVKCCVYGHLHGIQKEDVKEQNVCGIKTMLVSADYLDFKLLKIQ